MVESLLCAAVGFGAFSLLPYALRRLSRAALEASRRAESVNSNAPAQDALSQGSRSALAHRASKDVAPRLKPIEALQRRAAQLAEPLLHEPVNRRFHEPLTGYVAEQLVQARRAVEQSAPDALVDELLASVKVVLDELEVLIEQRRDTRLAGQLGDVDTLALACYEPIALFARSRGIPLTTISPAAQLGPFEMSTWTGFIPTSIAPIFLPQDFFGRAVWWPAVAHEIAHDFLASTLGLEERLRQELGFLPFHQAYLPIDFQRGFSDAEVRRVTGAWFEELFCDVFGTMMCGPAYVATMSELFAAKEDPRETLVVGVDPDGRGYDCHPPAHLRVRVGCAVLERAGFSRDATRLRKKWETRNKYAQLAGEGAEAAIEWFLLFPTSEGYVRVAYEPFERAVCELAVRLYAGPIKSLGAMGLADIPGLDFGIHEHEEALRARATLLEGRVPRVRDSRAVIAGAVLASLDRPGAERSLLELARKAIPALGTWESRPDAYSARAGSGGAGLDLDAEALREAILLGEVLRRPGARRERRR